MASTILPKGGSGSEYKVVADIAGNAYSNAMDPIFYLDEKYFTVGPEKTALTCIKACRVKVSTTYVGAWNSGGYGSWYMGPVVITRNGSELVMLNAVNQNVTWYNQFQGFWYASSSVVDLLPGDVITRSGASTGGMSTAASPSICMYLVKNADPTI